VGDVVAKRFLVVTGEASGDAHAARLVEEVARLGPATWRGIAGPRLRAAGVEAIDRAEDLAVIGFSGILARLPRLFAARRHLLQVPQNLLQHQQLLNDRTQRQRGQITQCANNDHDHGEPTNE